MKKFNPDWRAMLTLRILTAAVSLFLLGVSRFYFPINAITFIVSIALVAAFIFICFIYLPLYFSALSYELDDKTVTRHGGVFFRSHKSVKFSTVQYTAAVTTPLSKYTGLNFAILFVYGGQLRLEFLNTDDCEEILQLVRMSRKEEL